MFYETGCCGRVVLGELPKANADRLAALPGEWLEFDPCAGAIVVRYVQPLASPCLPTISAELVRMLAEIPAGSRQDIAGGDLYVHTESSGQLVRLRVEPGGALRISWAHPDYARAEARPYVPGQEALVDPRVQCLNGCVSLVAASGASRAARELEALADTYEGLYPEGELVVAADEAQGRVQMRMHDLNLDVELLIARLLQLAAPASPFGRIDVSSFAAAAPEQHARFLFEEGKVSIQRPVLWEEPGEKPIPLSSTAA